MGVSWGAVIVIILGLALGGAFVALWVVANQGPIHFTDYEAQKKYENLVGGQFYSNMRYESSTISYSFASACSQTKKEDARSAFAFLDEETILSFNEKAEGEIQITCGAVSPPSGSERTFVAGEGGPYLVINASAFNIIKTGKISLYREEKCDNPNIAIHEILHALGFDHTGNISSIMYPISECDQTLDEEIIKEINKIYSVPSLPDLVLSSLSVNSSNSYINFEVKVSNEGITDAGSATLELRDKAKDKVIKSFDLGNVQVGSRKVLGVTNVWAFPSPKEVEFRIVYSGQELSKDNNVAVVGVSG